MASANTEAVNRFALMAAESDAALRARAPLQDRKFRKFVGYLSAYEQRTRIAKRLQAAGVDLLYVFVALRVYVEDRSIRSERESRGRVTRNAIRKAARERRMPNGVARSLLNRADTAYSLAGLSRVHCVDSLGWLQIYVETRTGKGPSASDLAYLIDGVRFALGRKPGDKNTDPQNIERELRRWRKNNPLYVALVTERIRAELDVGLGPVL